MNKLYTIFVFLIFSYTAISQPIINFSDYTFKSKLLSATATNGIARNSSGSSIKIDINNDNQIQLTEALPVAELFLLASNISSVVGIQHFTNLKKLNIQSNQISALNISQNNALEILHASNNSQLSSFITNQASLVYLDLKSCNFSTINIATNSNLTYFDCSSNNLTNLDVSNNAALITLTCSSNDLLSLDVSNNIDLEALYINFNPISTINLTNNVHLKRIGCTYTNVTSLDFSSNSELIYFNSSHNDYLTFIDARNGNNNNMCCGSQNILLNHCPALTCILVDSPMNTFVLNNWWTKDYTATYYTNESQCSSLAMPEITNRALIVYPNPVKENINIKTNISIDKFEIYSINGVLLLSGTYFNGQINTADLKQGTYFLKLYDGLNSSTIKLLKN